MSRKNFTVTALSLLAFFSAAHAEEPTAPPKTQVAITIKIDKVPVERNMVAVTMSSQTGGNIPVLQPEGAVIDENGTISAVITPAIDEDVIYTFNVSTLSVPPLICESIDCERVQMGSVIWMLQRLAEVR